MYELKQKPQQWHEKFDSVVLSYDFSISEIDKCIYIKINCDSYVIMCLYVDNILIFSTNIEIIDNTKSFLSGNLDTSICNTRN